MSRTWLARIAVIASMVIGLGAIRTSVAEDADVIVASGTLHGQLFLKDELTGSFGAVTFETADRVTASKFEPYDGAHINIVIQLDPAAGS